MPLALQKLVATVKEKNPSREYKMWGDEVYELFCIPRHPNLSYVSNIVRYRALYEYGGVYLDTDVEAVQSLDSLDLGDGFYVARLPHGYGVEYNAHIMACPAKHLLAKKIETAFRDTPPKGGASMRVFNCALEGEEFTAIAPELVSYAVKTSKSVLLHKFKNTWKAWL